MSKKAVSRKGQKIGKTLAPREAAQFKRMVRKYWAARERAKDAYAHADAILDKLAKQFPIGSNVVMDGKQALLVDQFNRQNVVFRSVGIKRYEIVTLSAKKRKAS